MLTIKCGREKIELNQEDIIMYNGVCYQVISRCVEERGYSPRIPKIKAEKLIKEGKLLVDQKIDAYITYYKFNMEA